MLTMNKSVLSKYNKELEEFSFGKYEKSVSQGPFKIGKWDIEEDEKLEDLIEIYGERNWKQISLNIQGRSPIQCLHRWTKILRPGLVKGHWKEEEDKMLEEWVALEGPTKWTECSNFIKGRTGKQCRERWFNVMCPNVVKGNWTLYEDFVIFYVYNAIGSKWAEMNKILVSRTENSIKNRFYSTLRSVALEREKVYNNKENQKSMKRKISTHEMLDKYLKVAYYHKVLNVQQIASEQGKHINKDEIIAEIHFTLRDLLGEAPLQSQNIPAYECIGEGLSGINKEQSVCQAKSNSVSGSLEHNFDYLFNSNNFFDFDTVSLYKFDEIEPIKNCKVTEKELEGHLETIERLRQIINKKYADQKEIKVDKKVKEDFYDDFCHLKEEIRRLSVGNFIQ